MHIMKRLTFDQYSLFDGEHHTRTYTHKKQDYPNTLIYALMFYFCFIKIQNFSSVSLSFSLALTLPMLTIRVRVRACLWTHWDRENGFFDKISTKFHSLARWLTANLKRNQIQPFITLFVHICGRFTVGSKVCNVRIEILGPIRENCVVLKLYLI